MAWTACLGSSAGQVSSCQIVMVALQSILLEVSANADHPHTTTVEAQFYDQQLHSCVPFIG